MTNIHVERDHGSEPIHFDRGIADLTGIARDFRFAVRRDRASERGNVRLHDALIDNAIGPLAQANGTVWCK